MNKNMTHKELVELYGKLKQFAESTNNMYDNSFVRVMNLVARAACEESLKNCPQ